MELGGNVGGFGSSCGGYVDGRGFNIYLDVMGSRGIGGGYFGYIGIGLVFPGDCEGVISFACGVSGDVDRGLFCSGGTSSSPIGSVGVVGK